MIVKIIVTIVIFCFVLPVAIYRFIFWKPPLKLMNSSGFESLNGKFIIKFDTLKTELESGLKKFGFKNHESNYNHEKIRNIQFWKKKNLNINRAVVLIEITGSASIAEIVNLVHGIKFELGKVTGYISFLYEVGLQIVVVADSIFETTLNQKPVDTISNQEAFIQSLFIIDNEHKSYYKAQTWMQYVTGKFQKAIDGTIIKLINQQS